MNRGWEVYILLIIVVSITGLNSCVEPFDLSTSTSGDKLVVDGRITNETGPHIIILKNSSPLNTQNEEDTIIINYVTGANVIVENGSGSVVSEFEELSDGHYSSPADFAGEVGESYKLVITTAEGRNYESDVQELLPPAEIDNIYTNLTEVPDGQAGEFRRGVQFLADISSTSEKAEYFRYETELTRRIQVPFPSQYFLQNRNFVPRTNNVGTCYETEKSNKVSIQTTATLNSNEIKEITLDFVEQSDQKLRNRLSVLLKQFTITKNAFQYYSQLRINNSAGGSLSDQQNGPVAGNIISTDDPSEIVLGYFEVASVSERRAFFNPKDYASNFTPPPFEFTCEFDFRDVYLLSDAINVLRSNRSLQVYLINTPPNQPSTATLVHQNCTSCDWYASTEIPDFWID